MPFGPALLTLPCLLQAPSIPALVPGDREIAFAGFNLHPLHASVLGADGKWFAVMVAGSGPTDRNWSSKLLPPGQAGRDFAMWMRDRGIGSLRYDKRFIGAQDPKLDISLDAQVGDIRAALKAARQLPEARGRKLLLVGHSEGSLLGLMATGEADAVLLIGLPAQSMARTIYAQVQLQLPPERAAPNLAYLEQVFEAIRKDRPTPEGGVEVFPALVGLAKGLMRPETVGFVKATLDLDPWLLASRVSVPCAAAWGDRDVQTWKPEKVPATFKGAVIDLPETNHLLRRETRPRATLTGANAGSGYGSDTPMADLAPLAVWLASLN